jgi:hypothetical protein
MNLHEWQNQVRDGMRRGASYEGLFATPARGASLEQRFEVYRDGYWLRASESLVEDFSLSERLLGKERFESAIRDFLAVKSEYELELGELSPGFAAFLSERARASVVRALRLDLLAVEARRAPDPAAVPGGGIGLVPSARLLADGGRRYVFWRHEGYVRRERISADSMKLLEAFRTPAPVEMLGERLEPLALEPDFVQEEIAMWVECGLIVVYGTRSE